MDNNKERSPNDQRADVKNPNNPDYAKDAENRANLGHPPPAEKDGDK